MQKLYHLIISFVSQKEQSRTKIQKTQKAIFCDLPLFRNVVALKRAVWGDEVKSETSKLKL